MERWPIFALFLFLFQSLLCCGTEMVVVLLISGLFTLALDGDIAFFFYRVDNVVFNAYMYACM